MEAVYRNIGKLWAGKLSRNIFLDLLNRILHEKSRFGYPNNEDEYENWNGMSEAREKQWKI